MKKSVIALWIAAALFLACSFTFLPDGIGEFVCGVAIAAVLAFLGYKQHKKPKDAPPAPADKPPAFNNANVDVQPRSEQVPAAPSPASAEEDSPYEFIRTKIAGVTFKDGRKSRQTILRRLYWKDEPFDKNAVEVTLDREEYEGKPAYAVLLNGVKAGYVPAEHAQFVADNFDRCDGVSHIEAYCGKDDIYGAEIIIRFRKTCTK